MKKYYNKRSLILFFALFISVSLLDFYLDSKGYKGQLYFQTVYTRNNGSKSYGNFAPRTFEAIFFGMVLIYNSFGLKAFKKLQEYNLVRLFSNTLLIIGVTISIIGCIDAVSAFNYLLAV